MSRRSVSPALPIGRAGLEGAAVRHHHVDLVVVRVDAFFHGTGLRKRGRGYSEGRRRRKSAPMPHPRPLGLRRNTLDCQLLGQLASARQTGLSQGSSADHGPTPHWQHRPAGRRPRQQPRSLAAGGPLAVRAALPLAAWLPPSPRPASRPARCWPSAAASPRSSIRASAPATPVCSTMRWPLIIGGTVGAGGRHLCPGLPGVVAGRAVVADIRRARLRSRHRPQPRLLRADAHRRGAVAPHHRHHAAADRWSAPRSRWRCATCCCSSAARS